MRKVLGSELETARIREGTYKTKTGDRCGAFELHHCLRVVANAACQASWGWDHVSVSLENRTPTWEEMCRVKDLFFEEEETVVQFHPPKSQYINYHPYCLHLWRKRNAKPGEMPPSFLIGPKSHET